MARISSYRNSLVSLANSFSNIGWACDLICKIISTDGKLSDSDIEQIADSLKKGKPATLTPPATENIETTPILILKSLEHISGVNALESNQKLYFCPNQFTLIYGLNGSGKSSYFRIMNNLVSSEHKYDLRSNIYLSSPPSKSVEINYSVDGLDKTFIWNTTDSTPDELRHVRVFDSQYSAALLQPQENGDYIFRSYTLSWYRGLVIAVNKLKVKGLNIDSNIESKLLGLCSSAYQQLLVDTLKNQFEQEKKLLGLTNLSVEMAVDDVINNPSIYIHIDNAYDPNDILSEGELKGISLALFLAESDIQQIKSPLIIDDPVNSLDSRIMVKFVERLQNLTNQVILFTHNIQLNDLIRESKKFKLHPRTVNNFATTGVRDMYAFQLVYESRDRTGIVSEQNEIVALSYLDKADTILYDMTAKADDAIPYLRIAIEYMVDEIIFKKQSPLKYRGRANIQWSSYKQMITLSTSVVDDMKDIYQQLSNGGLHLGYGALAAPLTRNNLTNYLDTLRDYIERYSL